MTPEQIDLLKALKDLDQWVTNWLGQIHRDIDDDEKAKLADDMACDWFGSGMGASFRDQIAEAEAARADGWQPIDRAPKDGRSDAYLIIKRGLYYKPRACGYTGIRDHAGRYTLAEVAVRFPNLESENQDGMSFIHEDDAPEFTPACFHDLKADHLQKQRDEARAEVVRLSLAPFLICDGCGTAMTDAELAAEQAKCPDLRSCCPERKMRPITREDWARVRKEWGADLVRLGRRHREVQAEVEQARAEIARGARRTDHRFTP